MTENEIYAMYLADRELPACDAFRDTTGFRLYVISHEWNELKKNVKAQLKALFS